MSVRPAIEALCSSARAVPAIANVIDAQACDLGGFAVRRVLHGRGVFFLVTITSEGLTRIAHLLESGHLTTNVGDVLPFADARLAHEMLAGEPPKRGKIVLTVEA